MGSETLKIGVLSMLRMQEKEMEAYSRAQNLADYLMNLYGYSSSFIYSFFPDELSKGVGDGTRLAENTGALSREFVFFDRLDEMQMALNALNARFPDNKPSLIQVSCFDVPFGGKPYDAAVSGRRLSA